MTDSDKIRAAIAIAGKYGTIDGDDHKMWVIDQMVRALTGCPTVTKTATDSRRRPYTYQTLGESAEYKAFVEGFVEDDEGEKHCHWESGISP